MKDNILNLFDQGLTKKEIADELDIGYSTVRKYTKGLVNKPRYTNTRGICRSCGETDKDKFYTQSQYQCKSCWNKRTYQTAKDKILEYMESRGGAKCCRCGYDKYIGALDFHHRDPAEKDPTWSRGWSLPKLKKELDKCDIVCANCHREIHAGL